MRSLNWRQRGLLASFVTSSIVALLAGCGGGGGSSTPVPSPTPCSTIAPQLSVLQTEVFTPTCALSSCHGHTSPQNGFDLSSPAEVLATGTNQTAQQLFNGSPVVRIVPGSHASSYLWLKVTGANGIDGLPMPWTGQGLSSCATDAITQWIDAGAPNN